MIYDISYIIVFAEDKKHIIVLEILNSIGLPKPVLGVEGRVNIHDIRMRITDSHKTNFSGNFTDSWSPHPPTFLQNSALPELEPKVLMGGWMYVGMYKFLRTVMQPTGAVGFFWPRNHQNQMGRIVRRLANLFHIFVA